MKRAALLTAALGVVVRAFVMADQLLQQFDKILGYSDLKPPPCDAELRLSRVETLFAHSPVIQEGDRLYVQVDARALSMAMEEWIDPDDEDIFD